MKRTSKYTMLLGGCSVLLLVATVTAISAKNPGTTGETGRLKAIGDGRASTGVTTGTDVNPGLAAAADFTLPWYSFNGGGSFGAASPTMGLSQSVGQSAPGRGSSSTYALDMGFLAGADFCNCPFQSDIDEDGFVTGLDLGSIIDILFEGGADVQDPNCPTPRADFNCSGFSESTDLGSLIDYLFVNGIPPCAPCSEF